MFLIRSRAGGKKYVTRLRLVTYFLQPAVERIKNTYCMHGQETLSIFVNVHVFIHCIINIVCISFCLAAFWRINSPIKVFIWYTTAQLNDQQWLLTLCSNDSFVLVSLNFLCDNTAWQQTTTRSNRSITTRTCHLRMMVGHRKANRKCGRRVRPTRYAPARL